MSSKKEIFTAPGIPFSISPNLESLIKEYDYGILVDEIDFVVQSVGRGRIKIFEVHLDFLSYHPRVSPSGRATPYSFQVEVDYQTQEQLEALRCALIYENSVFEGLPDYDEVPLIQDARTTVRYEQWVNPEDNEVSNVFFLAEELEHVQFIVG